MFIVVCECINKSIGDSRDGGFGASLQPLWPAQSDACEGSWGLGSPTRVLSIDGRAVTVSTVKHGHRPQDDTKVLPSISTES